MSFLLNIPVLLVSFVVGLVLVLMQPVEHKTVFVYPTPLNVDKLQYKDKANNCFAFTAQLVDCSSAKNLSTIPFQT